MKGEGKKMVRKKREEKVIEGVVSDVKILIYYQT